MSNQPHVVLITTDQQRFDTIGPHKPPFLRTPHLDALCRDGVRFDRAYADCPLCVPSRTTIMTGNAARTTGMDYNGITSEAMGREETLPGRMRKLGYQTAAIGKMHFRPQRMRHGFDEMILPDDYYRQMRRAGHKPMAHGVGQNELPPTCATVPEALTLTNWTADQSLEYLRHRRDPGLPTMLWCSFSKPHPPFDPPEPYFSMYRDEDIPEAIASEWRDAAPEAFAMQQGGCGYDAMTPRQVRAARVAYYGLITHIDHAIGRVIGALKQAEMLDDTLIIFASDHGEYLGDHRAGGKKFFHEVSARVPMIVRMPRTWEDRRCGETCDELVTLADILPTCTPADDVDGVSLIDTARGKSPRDHVTFTAGYDLALGVTDGKWKYLYYPQGGREQLFDLVHDPQERHDVADKSKACDLRQKLIDDVGELPCVDVQSFTPDYLGVLGLFDDEFPVDVRH